MDFQYKEQISSGGSLHTDGGGYYPADPIDVYTPPTIKPLILEEDNVSLVKTFERVTLPGDTEPIHNFPMPVSDEIIFDEPPTETIYPTTEPPAGFYENLDLTLTEFKGDIVSTPISLETDRPLIGEVTQKPLIADTGVKESSLVKAVSSLEKKPFNFWLLIIAAAVLIGVFYLSKSK